METRNIHYCGSEDTGESLNKGTVSAGKDRHTPRELQDWNRRIREIKSCNVITVIRKSMTAILKRGRHGMERECTVI